MGEVYRARDTRLGRDVAIKILPKELSADPVQKQRFEREAKTISGLNHPHICVLHDVGYQNGMDYLVMECVEGETLAKRLEKGPLPLEQVLKFGAQIADALDKAHRSGVVHRDLKPGNIMVTASGAKLLDFGLAKPVAPLTSVATLTAAVTQDSPVTQQGTIVGTFQYMSPEQVEAKELDGRSDIFSLGAVLYEMVTGKRAFEGRSQLSVASAILEKEPTPIGTLKPMTPPSLDHTVKKCLAKDPDERWQSASDLKSELNWIVESGSQTGVSASVGSGRKTRERMAWAGVAASAVAIIALLAVHLRQASLRPALVISSIVPPSGTRLDGVPKVSPDGRILLLDVIDTDGRNSLWLRSLDSSSAQPIAGTGGAYRPFWSPDGRSIGFFAGGKLKTIQASGGPVLTLCDAPFSLGGSWSKEGDILFVPQWGAGIYKVPASGGSPTLVLSLDRTKVGVFASPDFLPDGKHFTYTASSSEAANSGTYFASIDGRENKLITRATGNRVFSSGYLFFAQPTGTGADLMVVAFDPASGQVEGEPRLMARDIEYLTGPDESFFAISGPTLIYATSQAGPAGPTLTWLDRSGKRISVVAGGDNASDMKLSPDAQKVAYSKGDPNSDIWVQELKRDVPMRLTFDTSVDKGAPIWSPDGSEVLFDVALGGKTPPGIYRKSSSGTGHEELLAQPKEPDAMLWPTDWSWDSKFILCVQGEIITRDRGEIWVVPALADRKPRVFIRAPGAAYDGQFSPDGRWVAYVSRESGRQEVYVVPFDGNQVLSTPPFEQVPITKRWQVSANGGAYPRWRRDGKELFYVGPGDGFVAVEVETKGNNVFSLGEARPLFRESLAAAAFPYDVSPDGQRFLVNGMGEEGTLPLTLVVNWKELLKSK
jgi:serine/threonine protein kinase